MSRNYITKADIIKSIKIVDIAEEFGIDLEETSSGNFDCRCTCPSSEHKNGNERTGSLFVDRVNNNFYCFGCNAGSNPIDFYMLCTDSDFGSAMLELKKRVSHTGIPKRKYVFIQNNFPIMISISELFRTTMQEHPEDLKWINSLMRKSDPHIFKLNQNDIDGANKLHDYIKGLIRKRYLK